MSAPCTFSATVSPPFVKVYVGTALTCAAATRSPKSSSSMSTCVDVESDSFLHAKVCGSALMSTLQKTTFSWSSDILSKTGAAAWHGPHHDAV